MNINEVNHELVTVRERLAQRSRLERDLQRIEADLSEQRARLADLAQVLKAESADVRRLEGRSLVGLLHSVMGSREARLDEERQQMLAARLKHDNAQRAVELLERDAQDTRRKLAGLQGLEQRQSGLLAEKEAWLRDGSDPQRAAALDNLDERLAAAHTHQRELGEAVAAGQMAADGLGQVVKALESAQNWGTWDLLGGGLLSSAVKHSRLDEAHQAVQASQPLLARFERELADVGGSAGIQIESGGLTAFADIFIDGLLIDLLVQSRIGESLDAARGMYERVHQLLDRLTRQQAEARRELQAVETERKAVLEL